MSEPVCVCVCFFSLGEFLFLRRTKVHILNRISSSQKKKKKTVENSSTINYAKCFGCVFYEEFRFCTRKTTLNCRKCKCIDLAFWSIDWISEIDFWKFWNREKTRRKTNGIVCAKDDEDALYFVRRKNAIDTKQANTVRVLTRVSICIFPFLLHILDFVILLLLLFIVVDCFVVRNACEESVWNKKNQQWLR